MHAWQVIVRLKSGVKVKTADLDLCFTLTPINGLPYVTFYIVVLYVWYLPVMSNGSCRP